MRTRSSHNSSPLLFDPEIERNISKNRIFHRQNKVIGSPSTQHKVMDTHEKPENKPEDLNNPSSGQQTPPIPPPQASTFPSSLPEQNVPGYSFQSNIPPFNKFFPSYGQTYGQSSSYQGQPFRFQQDPPITHTQPNQPFAYATPGPQQQRQPLQPPPIPFMGRRQDQFDNDQGDEFEDYEEGYEAGGGGNLFGNQGGNDNENPAVNQREPGQPHRQPLGQAQQNYGRPQGFRQQQAPPQRQGVPHQRAPVAVPQRHNRDDVRGIESHFRPIITNNPSPVVIPQHRGRSFEVRTNSLQSLPKFHGLATEEPYFHLEAYDSICNTIGGQGFSPDAVKLVLFQFSLEDKAKRWFHTLPSASIYTWAEMQQRFLDEFYTNQKTSDARRNLRNFQQQSGELYHEAFDRFNLMLKNCPHHGIDLWDLLNAFHEGLTPEDARDLMSISNR